MATKYISKAFKYGLLKQTNWATVQAAGANFKGVYYTSGSVTNDPGVTVGTYNASGQYGIQKEFERVYVDGRSGLARLNFSMLGDVNTLAPHLAAALFATTEVNSGTYAKVFTAGGLAGTIDFNGDGTELWTLCRKETAAGSNDGVILENCIIENLNLSWDFLANGTARLLQVSGNWVGNEMNYEQDTSGTWTNSTMQIIGDADLMSMSTFTVNTVDWSGENIRSFSFNVANNVTADSATTAGKVNNYDVSPVYTSKIILDYNATTEDAMKDFQEGKTIVATIVSSLGAGTDGYFAIACTGGILQKPPFIFNGDYAGIELDVLWHSTAGATPVTINLEDTFDWNFSAP
ncbi:MAG: hypothetical protein WBB97_00010 [Dehalococcoidales bacterium]